MLFLALVSAPLGFHSPSLGRHTRPVVYSPPVVMGEAAEQRQMNAKARLLAACEAAALGRDAERRASVLQRIEDLEPLNPTPKPLEAPELLSGW